jgi:hypothetical protein
MLRTGKAGSNTAADHISVLSEAIAQVPVKYRKDLLVRCDGAGASHDLLDWLTDQGQVRGRRLEYSVGFAVTESIREAITLVPANLWAPASIQTAGSARAVRSPSSPGSSTSPPGPQRCGSSCAANDPTRCAALPVRGGRRLALPGLRHQHRHPAGPAVGVPRGPTPGPRPCRGPDPARQGHWIGPVPLARVRHQPGLADRDHDRRRPRGLDPAPRFDRRSRSPGQVRPKALRYRLLHVPARLTHTARRRRLQIPGTWPWATAIVAVFANIAAIPPPA